uniref:Uncharacterized protein n=1 Tax=Anguilla anguilla TaxID=7936 RepID=A0A0E9WDL3_ANGAN
MRYLTHNETKLHISDRSEAPSLQSNPRSSEVKSHWIVSQNTKVHEGDLRIKKINLLGNPVELSAFTVAAPCGFFTSRFRWATASSNPQKHALAQSVVKPLSEVGRGKTALPSCSSLIRSLPVLYEPNFPLTL